jgi:zinc transport system ATP-binding protein
MKLKNKAKITSQSSATTLPLSEQPLHANKNMLIDIDNLSVRFGAETVVEDVSLCVHSGEFVGIIGPNGAGKTTLLRVILGLLAPTTGKVKRPRAGTIGYIPQHSTVRESQIPISVLEVVQLGARGVKAKAMQALQAVHMTDVSHKRFTELSGGQQQRVFIAKALAGDPAILVLDEPTTGIDERSQTEFYDILRTLQQNGIAVVMVSHDIDAVLRLVTRVVCLNHTILYDGAPAHFEADKYMPTIYKAQHRMLHHHHGTPHA